MPEPYWAVFPDIKELFNVAEVPEKYNAPPYSALFPSNIDPISLNLV